MVCHHEPHALPGAHGTCQKAPAPDHHSDHAAVHLDVAPTVITCGTGPVTAVGREDDEYGTATAHLQGLPLNPSIADLAACQGMYGLCNQSDQGAQLDKCIGNPAEEALVANLIFKDGHGRTIGVLTDVHQTQA